MFSGFVKTPQRQLVFILPLLILLGLFSLVPLQAQAQWYNPLDWARDTLIWLFGVIGMAMGGILALIAALMDVVINLGNPASVPGIYAAWEALRNFANLFFGLGMVVIALGSIFQLEGYGWKRALPRLIIAALLINFSFVIAGTVIDVGNIFTGFFVKQFRENGLSTTIANGLRLEAAIQPLENLSLLSEGVSIGSLILSLILALIMMAVAIIVFAFGVFFLFIRIFMLWVFIATAPIVWIFWIFPATQTYWQRWWENFLKWVFYAPVYLFMVWLALFIITSGPTKDFAATLTQDSPLAQRHLGSLKDSGVGLTKAAAPSHLLQFSFLTIMLFGALWVAQQAGMYGAQGAMRLAQGVPRGLARATGRVAERWAARGAPLPKASKWIGKPLGWMGFKGAEQKLAKAGDWMRGTLAGRMRAFAPTLASPQVWTKYWATRRAKAEQRSFPYAAGQMEDVAEALWHPLAYKRGRRTQFAQRAYDAEIDKKQSELRSSVKSEEAAVGAYRAAQLGGDKVEIESTFRHLAQFNGYNTLFGDLGKEKFDEVEFREYMKNELAPIIGKERALTMALDISGDRAAAGNFSLVGTVAETTDKKTGRTTRDWANDSQQLATALKKMKEVEPQRLMTISHHDNVRGYERNKETGEFEESKKMSALGRAHIGGFTRTDTGHEGEFVKGIINNSHIEQLNRAQTRYLEALNNKAAEIEGLGPMGNKLINGFDADGRHTQGARERLGARAEGTTERAGATAPGGGVQGIAGVATSNELIEFLRSEEFRSERNENNRVRLLAGKLEQLRVDKKHIVPEIDRQYTSGTDESARAYRQWDSDRAREVLAAYRPGPAAGAAATEEPPSGSQD